MTRAELIEIKGGKCVRCGATEYLEFDHINPATRSFRLNSTNLLRRRDVVLREAEKCQLLCMSCHCRKSALERGRSVYGSDEHGTISMYNNKGCRCGDCRQARAKYQRDYYKRKNTVSTI